MPSAQQKGGQRRAGQCRSRDRCCPWGRESSRSRATRNRHAPLPGSGGQCPWEPLPWEAWAVRLCTCASHKCLLGHRDLGLSGRRVSCLSPESSVWELVRSLLTGGRSCGRSAQGALWRNQSIPTWALLLCPWDFPGKDNGVRCHFLLQRSREYHLLKSALNHVHMAADQYSPVCVGVIAQSCQTLCDPEDCSSKGSSVYGILQARVLEWVAISFSRGSSLPRDSTRSSALWADSLQSEP